MARLQQSPENIARGDDGHELQQALASVDIHHRANVSRRQ